MKFLFHDKLTNDTTWVESVNGCKKKNINEFNLLKPRIITAYQIYDTLISNFEASLPPGIFSSSWGVVSPGKMLMIDYYETPPKDLAALMSTRRRDHGLNECPYCGNPKSPDTLDHFIPKDLWSEFSIYPDNLVPQCRECAPIKGEKYYSTEKRSAMYIHPIFFDLISRVGFKIIVNFEDGRFSYDVRCLIISNVTPEEKSRIQLHLKSLDVKDRVLRYCSKTTSHWLKIQKKNVNDIKESFKMRIRENGDRTHDNWKVALYKGYLDNENALTYFNSLCPEHHEARESIVIDEIEI
ncbi:HNH endonuclease [Enterobacter kobei]|uniref:HNH endonuclease n=1 Tax=Enterobacter kobei TaxID=208224 RepID=UPI0020068376|nr:HNH endonuclease [Enterobacter kobei]MCK7036886.1 HNH endonuclease [Enterobacter kobei]